MAKMTLRRAYVYNGKDYGPGTVDVQPFSENTGNADEDKKNRDRNAQAIKDLQAKEAEYQAHLDAGGEPIPPITPSIASGQAEPQVPPRNAVQNSQGQTVHTNPGTPPAPAPAPAKPAANPTPAK